MRTVWRPSKPLSAGLRAEVVLEPVEGDRQLVEEGGLDRVRDDRVAPLRDLLDVPHDADGTGQGQ